jgi:phosphoribosylglycinamide formyltransferase 1
MKIAVFTGNSIRHKFVANSLSSEVDESLIISECTESDSVPSISDSSNSIIEHFYLRYKTEKQFFSKNNIFTGNVLPILYKEVNLPYVFETVQKFKPDMIFVFGSSIIKEPLLSLTPNKFINLHLGLSPYYRGSGTNFWPFVNNELEFVGSTLLHLDPGIDTGDIISHVRPQFEKNDNVHTIGCKVIEESTKYLIKMINMIKTDKRLPRIKQWDVPNSRYYKKKDFDEDTLFQYHKNLKNKMIENFLDTTNDDLKLISLDNY